MKRHAGQAGRVAADLLHGLGRLLLLAVTLALLALCLLALRLAKGPVEIPYLASRLATAVSGQGISVDMRHAQLAWAGFHEGGDVPLYLALGDTDIRSAGGVTLIHIPRARLIFSADALLGGGLPILVTAQGATFNGSAVPVSLIAALKFDFGFALDRADVAVRLGAGRLGAGGDSAPITTGAFRLVLTPGHTELTDGRLTLAPINGSAPHVTFAGTAARGAEHNAGWAGSLRLTADEVGAAALPAYWPAAMLPHTRAWVVKNIHQGTVSHAAFRLGGTAPSTLSGIAITAASGGFSGTGLTMTWLPHATPITALDGTFTLSDIDHALITASAGQIGQIAFKGGAMTITGLNENTQVGDLTLPLAGRVEDAIAVLNAPPLSLLKAAPPGVVQATGDVRGQVTAKFPFLSDLTIDKVDLHADLALTGTTVPVPLLGLAFTNGNARLNATTSGLSLSGDADFAGGPCQATLHAVFDGPDVLHDAHLTCTAGAALRHWLELDTPNAVSSAITGPITYDVSVTTASDHSQSGQLEADFSNAAVSAPHLAWSKAAGAPGHLSITATMAHDELTGVSAISARAPHLSLSANMHGDVLSIAEARIGETNLTGHVTMPQGAGPWVVDLSGPRLAVLISPPAEKTATPATAAAKPVAKPSPTPPSGPLWQVHLAVARATLAASPAPALASFNLTAGGQGTALQTAHLQTSGIEARLTQPAPAHEALALTAPDAGFLLEALGASRRIQGGDLSLSAAWTPGAPIDGTLDIESFSILNAPVFAKIMQGLTLYGVGDATTGPGLQFSTLDAPFSLAGDTLTLHDARAYSPSLGFTAAGTVGLNGGGLHISATIIPAYALNSLPGKLPVIGHLFTAETGGGLFALGAHITGPLDDPDVSINPLSALTPGIIRKLFGIGF